MIWQELERELANGTWGVRGIDKFSQRCFLAAREEPDDAACLMLLGMTAERFAEYYRDAPLQLRTAEERGESLLAAIREFKAAKEAGPEAQMKQANAFALRELADWGL